MVEPHPAVAVAGAAAVFAGRLAWQHFRGRSSEGREATRWALLVGLVLLSHTLADYVLVYPLRVLPYPEFDGGDFTDPGVLLPALGRELLQQAGDLVFYGAIALLALRLLRRVRRAAGVPPRPS